MQMYKQMLRRCLSALLALTLLIAMIPNSALPVFSVEDEAGDYASNIGNAARFNEVDWSDFIVATKPFAYDGSAMEDENLIGMDQIDDDLVVVISDYYHETETCSLWYKIEAAPGSTLPAALKGRHWVYQNWTDVDYQSDSLIITETPKTGVVDTNGDAVTSVTLPSSSCV